MIGLSNPIQFTFPGWPVAAAVVLCVALAGRTAIGCYLLARVGYEGNLPLTTSVSWQPPALIAIWLVVGAGLWFRRNWALATFWVLAVGSLLLSIGAMVFVSQMAGRSPSYGGLIQSVVLVAVAWSLQGDRASWPAASSASGARPAFPAINKLKWRPIGALEVESREMLVCDPAFVLGPEDMQLSIADVRNGLHIVEVQVAALPAPRGKRIARARILWEDFATAELAPYGEIPVDLALLSVCDPARFTRQIPHDEVESSRWPWSVIGDTLWGCCRDARGEIVLIAWSSGFGDGKYPVYRLIADGRWVGILIDMAESDPAQPMHFGTR